MKEAVIVSIARTPVGRAKKGSLAQTRAEDLGRTVLEEVVRRAPGLNKSDIEDVILGCAMPEGEQGLNMARILSCMQVIRRRCLRLRLTGFVLLACNRSHLLQNGLWPALRTRLLPAE